MKTNTTFHYRKHDSYNSLEVLARIKYSESMERLAEKKKKKKKKEKKTGAFHGNSPGGRSAKNQEGMLESSNQPAVSYENNLYALTNIALLTY